MLKKISAAEHSLHLTDLRGGATHQSRKAWEWNTLGSVAWEDSHRAQTQLKLPRIWCKPWTLADLYAFNVEWCKTYLFRPTNEFPSLWLPLLIRKHQRMRNCKERLQRNLPTHIFSSLVVSKISKHKSYKFVVRKISFTIESSMMVFTQRLGQRPSGPGCSKSRQRYPPDKSPFRG